MLWGLLLGVLPIAIHLLLKRQARIEPWGAMQFLHRVLQQQHRHLRVQSWVHLLTRVAIPVCLTIAIADPRSESEAQLTGDAAPVHRVLVLDTSLSMRARDPEVSRFERAKSMARMVLSRVREGDSCQIVAHGGDVARTIIARPTFETDSVLRELDGLSATYQPGNIRGTFESVRKLLELVPEGTTTEVLFFTDLQAADWVGDAPPGNWSHVARLIQDISNSVRLSIIDVGSGDLPNVAITELKRIASSSAQLARPTASSPESSESLLMNPDFVRTGQHSSLGVTLTNLGDDDSRVTVELLIDSIPSGQESVRIAGRQTITRVFDFTIATPGFHLIEARISDDALAADNRRWMSLTAIDNLKILIIEGTQQRTGSTTAADYLQFALSPPTDNDDTQTLPSEPPFELHVIDVSALNETPLDQFDAVFLCDLPFLNQFEAEQLSGFVNGGGGLIITTGDHVQPEAYQATLGSAGAGLLPAMLLSPGKMEPETTTPLTFVPASPDHPILAPFMSFPGAGLETSRVYRYHKVQLNEEVSPHAKRILNLSNGDPLLLEKRFGEGMVLLLTTGIDKSWGSWVVWPTFVPLMHEAIEYVVRGRSRTLRTLMSEPLPLPSTTLPATWTATSADGTTITETTSEPALSPHTSPFETPGVYTLRLESSAPWRVVRNIGPGESDLTRLPIETLRSKILEGIPVNYVTDSGFGLLMESKRMNHNASWIGRWLVLFAIGLVTIDLIMGQFFTLGVVLLGTLAALVTLCILPQGFGLPASLACLLGVVLLHRLTGNRPAEVPIS